jgi:hypothetical protein
MSDYSTRLHSATFQKDVILTAKVTYTNTILLMSIMLSQSSHEDIEGNHNT